MDVDLVGVKSKSDVDLDASETLSHPTNKAEATLSYKDCLLIGDSSITG